jgi:hypothetical protein
MWHVWETEKVHRGLWWGELMEINHLEDLDIGRRIILKRIIKKWEGRSGLDWIDLAQDTDRWRAVVNAEINLRVP